MQQQTKTCQNCDKEFTIEPDDFLFYDKVKVPPPTFCPECRLIRRMAWRNERTLYKRKCDAPGHSEEIISIYHKDSPFKVYDQKYWWSDAWDSMEYGRDYDFSKPFFEQFRELLEQIPLLTLFNGNAVNSEYANHAVDSKNSFLISAAFRNENVLYSNRIIYSKDSADLYLVGKLEFCYEAVNCGTSYKLIFSYGCEDCIDSWFLFDCRNCSNCFGCVGLRNKSYYIFNKPCTKESYYNFLNNLDTGSYKIIQQSMIKHRELVLNFPKKYIYSFKTTNVVGDIIGESKNCYRCFDVVSLEDCKFSVWGVNLKDTYDSYGAGLAELLYEIVDTGGVSSSTSRIKFSIVIWSGYDIQYSYNCHGSNNLFGCVGLRHKQYCILNKQYTKEEYERLVPKIIEHMNEMPYISRVNPNDKFPMTNQIPARLASQSEAGRQNPNDKNSKSKEIIYKYGEFFPPELSPFAYNETIVQEYFPLTKEEAITKGYRWKEPESRNYQISMKTEDIPDHIKDVPDSITDEIIQCGHTELQLGNAVSKCNEQCTTAFKIIPQELQFYRRMNLPLPRLCPNCRHYERIKQRNPLKLWHRQCQCGGVASDNGVYRNTIEHFHKSEHCPNEFETTYAPEREEIVYCEKCYQSEVV